MEVSSGAHLAQLMFVAFQRMVDEVVDDLATHGHPGVSAHLEFALAQVAGGASTAADLGRCLGVSKQAAAKTIATLELLGYVERATDAQDRRRVQVQVSDRGHEMVAFGAARFDAIRRRWRSALAPGELDQFEHVLARLASD